ncbi:hypothetical protein LTR17_003708 [Elasticomyces elasticus]|nr:hypothetical protein LTR17_003708 [Elasticomyces elasticus]
MANTTLMPSDRFLAVYWMHRAKRLEKGFQTIRADAHKVPDWLQTTSTDLLSMDSDEMMRAIDLAVSRGKEEAAAFEAQRPARDKRRQALIARRRADISALSRWKRLSIWLGTSLVACLGLLARILLVARSGGDFS